MHTFSRLPHSSRAVRALAGLSLLALAAGAQAGDVYWSVNVDAPVLPVGRVVTAVSNVPAPVVVYRSAPVVVQQPPTVYYGAPVVVQLPQPVYSYGSPYQVIYQQPQVVQVVEPRRGPWPWWGHHHHHEDHDDDRGGDRGWDRWDGGGRVMIDPRENNGGRDGGRGDEGRGRHH